MESPGKQAFARGYAQKIHHCASRVKLHIYIRMALKSMTNNPPRIIKLIPNQLKAGRSHPCATHTHHFLSQLDQLHKLGHSIHTQQRQEPVIERFNLGAITVTLAYMHSKVK